MKKLGFGLMRLPLTSKEDTSSIDMDMMKNMVDTFLEKGFTYFDTAYMYHMGMSEAALKEALVDRHPRDRFTVATKLPTMFLKEEGDQERIFDEQLAKCGVDYFDYYLLHNLGVTNYETAKRFDSFAFIEKKKREGKIQKIGFSFHDSAKLLDQILQEHPEVDFVQLQINYLDWDSASIQSRQCYETACKHNKPVIVMEPVKGGALADVPKKAKALFRTRHPNLSDASWAVRFAASHDSVIMVLSGMSDMGQMLDNTAYMQVFEPFDDEEFAIVRQVTGVIREMVAIPCTSCRYCVEGCPKKIAIPEYFALYNVEKASQRVDFSIQQVYYNNYTKIHGKASECIACGKCERSCPQHIEIIASLKEVAAAFEAKLPR